MRAPAPLTTREGSASMARTYTYEQVSTAVNAGADLVTDGLAGLGDMERDLVNLVVNAALTVLEQPRVRTFDGVVRRCYSDSPREVRRWWDWD